MTALADAADALGRPSPPLASRQVVEVMGTVVSLAVTHHRVPADHGPGVAAALAGAVDELHRADAIFSTYRRQSEISRLRRGELTLAECSPCVGEVLTACQRAQDMTDGAFTARWDGSIDPTGLVKGWAAQRASAALRRAGFFDHAVGAGGDVVCAGRSGPGRCWQIGVADPHRPRALVAVVEVGDGAVATSGTAERGAHVVDPRTGSPARGLVSATVVGPDLTLADALATAAVAGGRADAPWMRALRGYELLTVDEAGRRWATGKLTHHLAGP